jgi:hypothetical protein
VRHWLEGPEKIRGPLRELVWGVAEGTVRAEANYESVRRHLRQEAGETCRESIWARPGGAPQPGSPQALAVERLAGVDPARYFQEVFRDGPLQPGNVLVEASRRSAGGEARIGCDLMENGREVGMMRRVFQRPYRAEPQVCHEFLSIDKQRQGSHLVKGLMTRSVNFYESSGYHKIFVSAGLDVGGYAWARYGFAPTTSKEITTLVADVSRRLKGLQLPDEVKAGVTRLLAQPTRQTIWTLSDLDYPLLIRGKSTTLGKALLLSSTWEGELDLRDPEARGRLLRYLSTAKKETETKQNG